KALWPLRAYLRYSPIVRGKGFLIRHMLLPLLLPPPASFETVLPDERSRVRLYYYESLGLNTMLRGGFEIAEARIMRQLARPNCIAIDVGANLGLHTLILARAVGAEGKVWAFEPLSENVKRLIDHIAFNELDNVSVFEIALGSSEYEGTIFESEDRAFASLIP